MTENEKVVTNNELLKCLMDFKIEITKELKSNKEDTKKMDTKISNIDDKIEIIRKDTENESEKNNERDKLQNDRMQRMENRLNRFDEEVKRMKYQKIKQNKLKQMETNLIKQPENREQSPPAREQPDRDPLLITATSFSSEWAKSLEDMEFQTNSISSINTEPEKTKNAPPKIVAKDNTNTPKEDTKKDNKDTVKNKNGMKALIRWFGDETSDEDDTEDDSETEQWQTVDRVAMNKKKAKAAKKKKAVKIEKINTKASHIIGLGPISMDCLNYHRNNTENYDTANISAVKDWLNNYLKFDSTEIEEMEIKETLTSAKGDGIMYVAFTDKSDIAEIYARIAESQNKDISTRSYIPPQAFDRYMMLNRKCKDLREHRNVRTQIRFGKDDLEIYVKDKDENTPYTKIDLSEVTDMKMLPGYDLSKKWTTKKDRPPRRRINYDMESTVHEHPANRKDTTKAIHPISRENSGRIIKKPTKMNQNDMEKLKDGDMDTSRASTVSNSSI